MVFDHLIHHGYSETAAAVARAAFPAAAQLSAAQLADMARRAAVHGALARGDVDSALTALQGCPPLDARVAFKLKCQVRARARRRGAAAGVFLDHDWRCVHARWKICRRGLAVALLRGQISTCGWPVFQTWISKDR